MKKALSLLAAVAVVAMASSAMAAPFTATKHNMTTYISPTNVTAGSKEICVYCHTPHNAVINRALWNRNNPATAGFKLYTSGANDEQAAWFKSGTKGTIAATSSSLMCLSCHDGSTAINSMVKVKNPPTLTNNTVVGAAALGTDLTNDHPINLNYATVQADGTQTGKLNAPASLVYAKLINGDLECASCHDVHNTSNSPFLRATMSASVLCLDCHAK